MVALLQTQNLAFVEHGPCVADDPKLKVHGRRHAGGFQKLQGIQPPNYPPSPTQATNLPWFLVLSTTIATAGTVHRAQGQAVPTSDCSNSRTPARARETVTGSGSGRPATRSDPANSRAGAPRHPDNEIIRSEMI